MKKIFSILLLLTCSFAHSQIGQFSPIWTYTGSNIQYTNGSTNTSSLNVNGPETVTGTFSVGSTATVSGNALFSSSVGIGGLPSSSLSSLRVVNSTSTVDIGRTSASAGAIWLQQSSPTSANYALNSDGSVVQLNSSNSGALNLQVNTSTKLGLNTGGVNVTGSLTASSTFSLGSANLTGGNTGTVAVLSDVVFCTQSSTKPYDPADGLTIYFANSGYLGLTTNATNNRIYVPKNCTLIGYDITGYIDGTSGTAETSTISIRIDNTTDVTLNSSITYTTTYQQWHSMALSTDINSGSYFNLKWVTPTWVTNPTSVVNSVVLWFKLR